jgi:hypothetical protein
VQRPIPKDNLLCLRKGRLIVTSDSDYGLPVYPNLARDLLLRGISSPLPHRPKII